MKTESKRIYLDTSIYLAALLGEKIQKQIFDLLQSHIFCSSTILLIEAERNLIRLTREKFLTGKDYEILRQRLLKDREILILRDLTPDLCLSANFPAIKTPRSNDLIHLRTAKWFAENGGLFKFITLDKDQQGAAQEMGLPAL